MNDTVADGSPLEWLTAPLVDAALQWATVDSGTSVEGALLTALPSAALPPSEAFAAAAFDASAIWPPVGRNRSSSASGLPLNAGSTSITTWYWFSPL